MPHQTKQRPVKSDSEPKKITFVFEIERNGVKCRFEVLAFNSKEAFEIADKIINDMGD